MSCYEFLSCLSDYLETKMKNRLIAAEDFSLLTNESTDILNHAGLSVISFLNGLFLFNIFIEVGMILKKSF